MLCSRPRVGDKRIGETKALVPNDVDGAMALQQLFEHLEWVGLSGDARAYAAHVHRSPLPGVPAKAVIIQVARGDQIVQNPATSALL